MPFMCNALRAICRCICVCVLTSVSTRLKKKKRRIGFELLWGSVYCIMVNSINCKFWNLVDKLNHNNVLSRYTWQKCLSSIQGSMKKDYVKWVSREIYKGNVEYHVCLCVHIWRYSLKHIISLIYISSTYIFIIYCLYP